MTQILSVYKEYIQKSRIFLYPILNVPRGANITPIQTYMEWENQYKKEDCKLIVVYKSSNDSAFKNFERTKLLSHQYFEKSIAINEKQVVYVFNLHPMKTDYFNITKGQYSKLSVLHKKKVLNFFKNHKSHRIYIESYLFPEKYFSMYSSLLNVNRNLLKDVGELCDTPNFTDTSLGKSTEILKVKKNTHKID